MFHAHSYPDPPRDSSLSPQILSSNKECPAKHSADAGHSRHTPYYFSHMRCPRTALTKYPSSEALSQTPQPSSNFALFQR